MTARLANAAKSARIEVLRMPLIIGVMFIHVAGLQDAVPAAAPGAGAARFIIQLISHELARTAVPLFFAISGYLFFNGAADRSFDYRGKLASRLRRLLVPFLCWNLLVLLAFYAVEIMPGMATMVSGANQPVSTYTALDWLSALLGIGRAPANYQLWFIRDLMVFQLASPLLLLTLRHAALPALALLLIGWLALPYSASPISIEGLTFFCFGACAALRRSNLFVGEALGWRMAGLAYLVATVALSLMEGRQLDGVPHKLCIVLGCIVWLNFSGTLAERPRFGQALVGLAASSFFVFAAHEPLLTLMRKVLARLLGGSPLQLLTVYFLAVALTWLTCLLLQTLLRRLWPAAERVLSGR